MFPSPIKPEWSAFIITPEQTGSDKYYLHIYVAQNAPSFKNSVYNCCSLTLSLSICSGSFNSISQMQAWFHVGDHLKWLLCVFIIIHHTE